MIYPLDRLEVTAIPTQENLKASFSKLQKQLIQKPRYASKRIFLTAGSSLKKNHLGVHKMSCKSMRTKGQLLKCF